MWCCRALLELLLRERAASLVRALLPSERSKEERDFVTLERVLRPVMYEEEDRREAEEKERKAREDNNLEDSQKGLNPGDKYDDARAAYESGAEVPWQCVWERDELMKIYRLSDREAEAWPYEDERKDVAYAR